MSDRPYVPLADLVQVATQDVAEWAGETPDGAAMMGRSGAELDEASGVLTLKFWSVEPESTYQETSVDFVEVGRMIDAVIKVFRSQLDPDNQEPYDLRSSTGQLLAEALDAQSLDEYPR